MLDTVNYLSLTAQETESEDQAVWPNRLRQTHTFEDKLPERKFLKNTVAQEKKCDHVDKETNLKIEPEEYVSILKSMPEYVLY